MGCDQSSEIKYRKSNRVKTDGNSNRYNINMSVFDEYGIDKDKNVILFINIRTYYSNDGWSYYTHYVSFIKPGTNTACECYRVDAIDESRLFNDNTIYLYTAQCECISNPSQKDLKKFGIGFSPEKGYYAL